MTDDSASSNNHLFCFGYGYSCDYLGFTLENIGGWRVSGTTRDREKRQIMRQHGIRTFLFDSDHPLEDPQYFLKDVTHILISTPPDDQGDPTFNLHGEDIAHLPNLKWIGYLSSISVYGDRQGAWVDETSETQPTSKRGSRRQKAERQWLSLYENYNQPVHIFRLAGIYGPGRSALDTVRAGVARRIKKEGHAFNRIHIDDIIATLIASMTHPAPGAIYNLCDDEPGPSHEVIAHACALLDRKAPPLINFEDVDLAPMTRSFYEDNKRIKNDKIKNDLHITLSCPNYRAGLERCLDTEKKIIEAAQG